MKKVFFTLVVLVMAFGNAAYAQRKANLKSFEKEIMFKHYGLRNDDIRPSVATWGSVFDESYRTIYTYDEYDYYLVVEMTEIMEDGNWRNFSMLNYEYDFSGNVLEILEEVYVYGDVWVPEAKASYSYVNGLVNEVIYQNWEDGNWVNETKEVYNYNGNVSTILLWEWNGSTWSSSELHTYTFSDTSIEVLMQYMQGGAWQNDEKDLFTLDFSGNVTEILVQDWSNNTWVNEEQVTYIFEGGVFTDKYMKEWNGSAWENDYHFVYDYDEEGNATRGECFVYGGYDWAPGDGDIEMAYNFNAGSNEYYGFWAEVQYVDVTSLKENSQTVSFMVYPNPAKDEINIQTENFGKAEIYSVTGQKVMENSVNVLDVSALSTGVYLLKVFDLEGNSETQRIVVK